MVESDLRGEHEVVLVLAHDLFETRSSGASAIVLGIELRDERVRPGRERGGGKKRTTEHRIAKHVDERSGGRELGGFLS